ncbi:Hypothetical protein R9X50_00254400 [Acrodontium crateriforme]|uniref:C2H2-type domain-containing protein n=1 Tax=Acrodontium crateriforme TaxID=150365 RepID=A0AAQ3M4G8_9PEZI|nr:Hypothetical protein R9X50_00254400 [Acrodontium crateriforme]
MSYTDWHSVYGLENEHSLGPLIESPAIALNGALQTDSICQNRPPASPFDRPPQFSVNNSRDVVRDINQICGQKRDWSSEFSKMESDVVGIGAWSETDLLAVDLLDDFVWCSSTESISTQSLHSQNSETYKENIDSFGDCQHRCDQCPKSFKTLDELERHAKTSLHRVFSCPRTGCTKRYYRRDSLARHKQVCFQKGNFKHACSICEKAFGRKDHLQQHMKNVHNQDWAPSPLSHTAKASSVYNSSGAPKVCSKAVRIELSRLVQSLGNDPNAVQTLQSLLSQHKLVGS